MNDRVSVPGGSAPATLSREDGVYLVAPGFNDAPFPALAHMQEEGPVHRVVFPDGLNLERWIVTGYQDVTAALNDPRLSTDLGRGLPELTRGGAISLGLQSQVRAYELLGRAVGNCDPPEHTRMRKLVVRAFSAKRTDRLRPWVTELTDKLLDAVRGRDEIDLMDALAVKLPIRVVCRLIGASAAGADICRAAATVLGGFVHDDESARGIIDSLDAFEDYARHLIGAKKRDPGDDLLSDLIAAEVDGERLTDDELVAMSGFLLFAGHQTTVQLIGNGVLALLLNPDQLARLRADRGLLPNAVEEFLRYDGPVCPGLIRYARDDVQICGVTIPRGSYVLLATAAANRDPAVWEHPGQLDVQRDFSRPHLAFGHGIHYCLGARLARTEAEIAIGALLDRYERISLAVPPGELRWHNGFLRGLRELPLRVS